MAASFLAAYSTYRRTFAKGIIPLRFDARQDENGAGTCVPTPFRGPVEIAVTIGARLAPACQAEEPTYGVRSIKSTIGLENPDLTFAQKARIHGIHHPALSIARASKVTLHDGE